MQIRYTTNMPHTTRTNAAPSLWRLSALKYMGIHDKQAPHHTHKYCAVSVKVICINIYGHTWQTSPTPHTQILRRLFIHILFKFLSYHHRNLISKCHERYRLHPTNPIMNPTIHGHILLKSLLREVTEPHHHYITLSSNQPDFLHELTIHHGANEWHHPYLLSQFHDSKCHERGDTGGQRIRIFSHIWYHELYRLILTNIITNSTMGWWRRRVALVYICTFTFKYTRMHVYIHIHTYTYIYVYIHAHSSYI